MLPEENVIFYFKNYLRDLDIERLTPCLDKIKVTFTSLDGFERRPTVHACAPSVSLELPSTY